MAINIDTVYQRVLSLANKEQRGHINPQQFNLLANQVQFDVFEDYFFKLAGIEFGQKNDSQYNDVKKITLEKLQPFDRSQRPIEVTNSYAHQLPDDVYRLGEVLWRANSYEWNTIIIPEISEKEFVQNNNTPLAQATLRYPTFIRRELDIVIAPTHSTDPAKQVVLFFDHTTAVAGASTSTASFTMAAGANLAYIRVGQAVTIPAGTSGVTVTAIDNSTGVITLSDVVVFTSGVAVTLTFASNEIYCNYIRRPNPVSWGYTEINSVALYNSASSVNFELHESEENTLVIKILALAGIVIKNPELMQIAQQEESKRK